MFSPFPCHWGQPKPRGLFSGNNTNIPNIMSNKTIKITKVPDCGTKGGSKGGFADYDFRDEVRQRMPESEMCIGEKNDFSDIDQMLSEMNDSSCDAATGNILNTIGFVNKSLDDNIRALEESGDGGSVNKEEILKIFKLFINYSHTLESHIKGMVPANCMNVMFDEESVGMKYMDISDAKILLVQIPEKLYLKEGYKSLERMMATLQKSGVVVVAVPETVNLINITEEDLSKLDLVKINDIRKEDL